MSLLLFFYSVNYNLFIKIFLKYIFGAKGSRGSDPLHIKPKAHTKEEEMPEDEQRESRLPGYIAKEDPILGKPKSRKGKAPRR